MRIMFRILRMKSIERSEIPVCERLINKADVKFDVRVYALQDVMGIRIRYNGKIFNPLSDVKEDDEMYMGIRMITMMAEEAIYQQTFGMNSVQILI